MCIIEHLKAVLCGILRMVQGKEMLAIGGVKADSGTKLYLSNLDYGVSDDDIEVFFFQYV